MTPSDAATTDRPALTWSQRDGVLQATLESPPANALGPPLVEDLTKLVDAFEGGSAKVLVLSSAVPGYFAAGTDIKHVAGLSVDGFADYRDAARAPLERLAACRRPSLAVIDGRALGEGLELAMACTLRFASPRARLGLPEIALGLIPGGGGTQRLPHLVGRGRALELMLTGREIDGEEALRIGLVDRVLSGDVLGEAVDIARHMARASGQAMAAIMQCVDVARDLPHDRGIAVESVALLSAFEEGEAREGIAAFLEKRPPAFA
jgi:enoyl-CoA hydratase/carnithine racemase